MGHALFSTLRMFCCTVILFRIDVHELSYPTITAQNVNILFPHLQEFGSLVAFRSPGLAIARTFIQLVGEFDFEDTFKEGTLLYSPAAYILFFTFLITMPILFTNFLVSCRQYAMCLDNPSEQAPFMWQHMLIGRPNT